MKKLIIVLAVGMIATDSMGQSGKKAIATPPAPPQVKDMPMPPPPPPAPPGEVEFTPPKIVKGAPKPPKPPVTVNEKGYSVWVQPTKEEPIILLTKKGVTQKIRMSVWNAKPEYFENKYGQLPPPPPAPPRPVPAPPPPKPPVPPVKK